MSVARVPITPELLAQMLCFPDGTTIVGAGWTDDPDRYVVLLVEHADLRAGEARPQFQRDDDHPRPGVTFIKWGQD